MADEVVAQTIRGRAVLALYLMAYDRCRVSRRFDASAGLEAAI
jgi:hypothetical protein